jgi:hypothetical protein
MVRKLRPGRISYDERLMILYKLGQIAQEKYNDYLTMGSNATRSYHLQKLRNSLQFAPDPKGFDNIYWIDTGNEELTKVAYYFEYGTGIWNTETRKSARSHITAKSGGYMIWKDKKSQQLVFAKRTQGVHPVFMMTKAVNYIRNNRKLLIRRIRLQLGYDTFFEDETFR